MELSEIQNELLDIVPSGADGQKTLLALTNGLLSQVWIWLYTVNISMIGDWKMSAMFVFC